MGERAVLFFMAGMSLRRIGFSEPAPGSTADQASEEEIIEVEVTK